MMPTTALLLLAICVLVEAFVSIDYHRCSKRSSTHHFSAAEEEIDWRAFRASLVQNGLPSLDNDLPPRSGSAASVSNGYAHITTPLVEVGSILVSIPTRDLCQGLDQQYWHRSVVLITEVSDNLVNGNVEQTVPDEELAMGDKRGKWSYRGLMLNRHTNSILLGSDDDTATVEEYERDAWKIQRGGDLLGLDSNSGTQFACLHQLGQHSDAASSSVVGNISYTTLSIAQALCNENPTKYHPDDFVTFGGFCSWRPGQLEREMGEGREEWIVLSVDWQSIWNELQLQREKAAQVITSDCADEAHEILLNAGTEMWRNFLEKIGMEEEQATSRLPAGQLGFYDKMLNVWAEEQLVRGSVNKDDCNDDDVDCDTQTTTKPIRPGAIARARSPPTNDMLLYDAEFLRSTILVLDETADHTVGVILNHPMSAAIECKESEDPLPLRYGGPIDIETWRSGSYRDEYFEEDEEGEDEDDDSDDEMHEGFVDYDNDGVAFDDILFDDNINDEDAGFQDDESSFLWIHRSRSLRMKKVGTQLGSSHFWLIKEDDALENIQAGTLQLHDTMVFSSVSIWEKGAELGMYGGGLREQVDGLNSLEIVKVDDQQMDVVWSILSNQNVLTKEKLDTNIDATIKAWKLLSSEESAGVQNDRHKSKERLSTAALKAYLARNLLGDPLNTLVEL